MKMSSTRGKIELKLCAEERLKLSLAFYTEFCYTSTVTVARSGEYALHQGKPFPAAVS